MAKEEFIPFEVIEQFMVEILMKAGLPEEDSKIVTDVLMQADKLGFDSHGVNRLKPIYLDRITDGILNPVTEMEIVKESPDGSCYCLQINEDGDRESQKIWHGYGCCA